MMLRFRWPAFELHANIARPVIVTNAYELLTPERELKATCFGSLPRNFR